MLARQRSGTHAVAAFLETHPDIFYINEIFHLDDAENPHTGETNFFKFVKKEFHTDPLKLVPVDHEKLFLDYLAFLRGFTNKRYLILDVKYNSAHHVLRNYRSMASSPYLFDLILKHGMRTFSLKRKNYLRYFVSITKAANTGRFGLRIFDPPADDEKVQIPIPALLHELRLCRAEDELVDRTFGEYARYMNSNYDGKFLTAEYADLFSAADAGMSQEFLSRFSGWLGIANEFRQQCRFKKQSTMPLQETIGNFDEVACALRGTGFEHCLTDEPSYSSTPSQNGEHHWKPQAVSEVAALPASQPALSALAVMLGDLVNFTF